MDTTNLKKKQKPQFLGIVKDAEILGVDRIHLWKVLTGNRESARLMRRYRELKARQAEKGGWA